ncbi:MAG: hypothetical protein PVG91_05265 [Gammaproteobacteria bacterium]
MNANWPWHGASGDTAETELQADVMRFVAILALCLVAISTLVEQATSRETAAEEIEPATRVAVPGPQPMPPPAASEPVPVTTPASPTPPPPSSTRVADAGVVTLTKEPPTPKRTSPAIPAPRPEPVAVARAIPEPSLSPPIAGAEPVPEMPPIPETPAPESPAPESSEQTRPQPVPEQRGFTLRFDSDAAMLRLVSRGEAGVFLIDGGQAWQLGFGDAGARFAQAPPPVRFHAIAADTVPQLLRDAAAQSPGTRGAVWGVTLPARTSRDLAALLRDNEHGELVIDSRGRVRLEDGDEA